MVFCKVLFLDQNYLIYTYINDYCNVSTILKFILLADDTTFICSKYDLNLCTEASSELNKDNDWLNINKLSLNLNKMVQPLCVLNMISKLCREASSELNKVNNWLNIKKLSLNLNNTNFMLFTNSKSSGNVLIIINTHIERVYVEKKKFSITTRT